VANPTTPPYSNSAAVRNTLSLYRNCHVFVRVAVVHDEHRRREYDIRFEVYTIPRRDLRTAGDNATIVNDNDRFTCFQAMRTTDAEFDVLIDAHRIPQLYPVRQIFGEIQARMDLYIMTDRSKGVCSARPRTVQTNQQPWKEHQRIFKQEKISAEQQSIIFSLIKMMYT